MGVAGRGEANVDDGLPGALPASALERHRGTVSSRSTANGSLDALLTRNIYIPQFSDDANALPLLRFNAGVSASTVVGANLDAVHRGGWTQAVWEGWGISTKSAAFEAKPAAELVRVVGPRVSWDDDGRKALLNWVADSAAALHRGCPRDTLACVVAGPRGTGKSRMFDALAAGVMLSSRPGSDEKGRRVYCGVLRRPMFLGNNSADRFSSLPAIHGEPVGNDVPISPVLLGLEVLRLHGVQNLPGGGFRELPSARTESEWATWHPSAFGSLALEGFSDWLKSRKICLILFLDEWQDNFKRGVEEEFRRLVVDQLSCASYLAAAERLFVHVVLGGSSSLIGPTLRYSGELVGRGPPHLRNVPADRDAELDIPSGRSSMHPARLKVVHLRGIQSLEQLVDFLEDCPDVKASEAVVSLLQRLRGEADKESWRNLLCNETVTMSSGVDMTLRDALEVTNGNYRALVSMLVGTSEASGEVQVPVVKADLDSEPCLSSLYWAMALELWHSKRSLVDTVIKDTTRISGRDLVVQRCDLRRALGRLKTVLCGHGWSKDRVEGVVLADRELERVKLVYSWVDSGYVIAHFGATKSHTSHLPAISALEFASASQLRAVFAGIASVSGTPLARRYLETIQRPEGSHARSEGEFMVFAALGEQPQNGDGRTNLGEKAATMLEVSAEHSPAHDAVFRALLERDDLPERTESWLFAQALCRKLHMEGLLGIGRAESGSAEEDAVCPSGTGDQESAGSTSSGVAERVAKAFVGLKARLMPGGGNQPREATEKWKAAVRGCRQAAVQAVLAAALERFPSTFSTLDAKDRFSEAPSPHVWNPDAMEGGSEAFRLGVLYKRAGRDRGADGIGAVMLPGDVVVIVAVQVKLTAEQSKNPLRPASLRDIAVHAHYDMATSGAVETIKRAVRASDVVPVLVVASNRASTLEAAAEGLATSAASGGASVSTASGAARTGPAPETGSTGPLNVATWAQTESAGGAEDAFDWVTAPGETLDGFEAQFRVRSAVRRGWQLAPRGGAVMVLTRSSMGSMWPAAVRLFANEHGFSSFGGTMSGEEKRILVQRVWMDGTGGRSLFEEYGRVVTEEEEARQARIAAQEKLAQERSAEMARRIQEAERRIAEEKRRIAEEKRRIAEVEVEADAEIRRHREAIKIAVNTDTGPNDPFIALLLDASLSWETLLSMSTEELDSVQAMFLDSAPASERFRIKVKWWALRRALAKDAGPSQ